MPELSKLHREIISRTTMAVVAIAMLYGGSRCIRAGYEWHQEFKEKYSYQSSGRRSRTATPALLPYLGGGVLLIGGVVFGLMAITPAETFAKIMGPPDSSRARWDE